MKKISAFAAILMLAAVLSFSLSACKKSGQDIPAEEKSDVLPTPAFDAYNAYVEAKANVFSEFTTRLYGEKDLVQTAGSGLLSLSSADVEFLPLALLQDAERSGGAFGGNAKGCYSCDAKIEDGAFSLEYTTYSGQREKITGSFDKESGAVSCEKYKDGVVCLCLEFVPGEGGYKAQYSAEKDEGYDVIRIVFGEGGSGFSEFEAESVPKISDVSDEEFLSGTHILIREQGESIFASIDGEPVEL